MTGERSVLVRSILATLLVVSGASPAHAHGNANLGEFYTGLLQPLFHPEFLLAALAVALWSTQQAERVAFLICLAAATGVALGGALAVLGLGGARLVPGPAPCMLVFGSMVAGRIRLPAAVCALLAGAAGVALGHTATVAEAETIARPLLFALGLALGVGLAGAWANSATQRFRALWLDLGVRVAGSWIAAIGLLASVMVLRRH